MTRHGRAAARGFPGATFLHGGAMRTMDTGASDEQLETLLRPTGRCCVACQTPVRPPTMTVTRQVVEA